MKQTTIGVFDERLLAEKAVGSVRSQLGIPSDDISFLYRDRQGEMKEVDTSSIVRRGSNSLSENISMGALAGAVLGALIGLAAEIGFVSVLTSFLAVGPIANIVSLTGINSAVGTIAVSALIGALLGALLGAIAELLTGNKRTNRLQREEPTNIVVAVMAPEKTDVLSLFRNLGAFDTRVYKLSI